MNHQDRDNGNRANEPYTGRTDNKGDQQNTGQQDKADISQVDRQEGNEANGETGGNFNSSAPEIPQGGNSE